MHYVTIHSHVCINWQSLQEFLILQCVAIFFNSRTISTNIEVLHYSQSLSAVFQCFCNLQQTRHVCECGSLSFNMKKRAKQNPQILHNNGGNLCERVPTFLFPRVSVSFIWHTRHTATHTCSTQTKRYTHIEA